MRHIPRFIRPREARSYGPVDGLCMWGITYPTPELTQRLRPMGRVTSIARRHRTSMSRRAIPFTRPLGGHLKSTSSFLLCFALITACATPDAPDPVPDATPDTPAETPDVRATLSPGEVIGFLDEAVGSTFERSSVIEPPSTIVQLTDSVVPHDTFDYCTTEGTPYNPIDGVSYQVSDDFWGAGTFLCALQVDSGSPETVPGSYGIFKGIACATETLPFEETPTTTAVSVSIDTTCFSQAFVDEISSDFGPNPVLPIQITTQLLDLSETDYTHEYTLNLGGDLLVVRVLATDEEIAVATNDGWALQMDLPTGELRYEYIHSEEDSSARHMKFYAQGTLDEESGTFTTVEWFEGRFGQTGQGVATLIGDEVGGYLSLSRTLTGSNLTDSASWGESSIYCYAEDDCLETSPIEFGPNHASVLTFGEGDSSDFTGQAPLSFTGVE